MGGNQVYPWPTTSFLNSSLILSRDCIIPPFSVLSVHCSFLWCQCQRVIYLQIHNDEQVWSIQRQLLSCLMQSSIWTVQKGLMCLLLDQPRLCFLSCVLRLTGQSCKTSTYKYQVFIFYEKELCVTIFFSIFHLVTWIISLPHSPHLPILLSKTKNKKGKIECFELFSNQD